VPDAEVDRAVVEADGDLDTAVTAIHARRSAPAPLAPAANGGAPRPRATRQPCARPAADLRGQQLGAPDAITGCSIALRRRLHGCGAAHLAQGLFILAAGLGYNGTPTTRAHCQGGGRTPVRPQPR